MENKKIKCDNCENLIITSYIGCWYGGNDPDGNDTNRFFCNDACRDEWEKKVGLYKEEKIELDESTNKKAMGLETRLDKINENLERIIEIKKMELRLNMMFEWRAKPNDKLYDKMENYIKNI